MTQFGAVGGRVWRLGGQKIGFMPRLIWYILRNWQVSNLSAEEANLKARGTQTCNFRHQITHSGTIVLCQTGRATAACPLISGWGPRISQVGVGMPEL
eukprot:1148996-Pelagomonas_calceolata.AAC.2